MKQFLRDLKRLWNYPKVNDHFVFQHQKLLARRHTKQTLKLKDIEETIESFRESIRAYERLCEKTANDVLSAEEGIRKKLTDVLVDIDQRLEKLESE